MGTTRSRIVAGIVLLALGVAMIVDKLTEEGSYYGPIVLLAVGLGLVVRSLLAEPEERKAPVGGVILIVLGVVSLLDALTASGIILAAVKGIAPYVLPVLLVVLGVRMIFRK